MKQKVLERRRTRIGFFFRHLRERYAASIWPVVLEAARAEGADAILFPESSWRCSHSFADRMDALLSLSSDIALQMDEERFAAFLARFGHIPRVHMSVEFEGEPFYGIDNYSGVREAVRHFVLEHQIRDIAFVTGPAWHDEAQTRHRAYREGLEELGIAYREEWVYRGDFLKESGAAALTAFLDERRLPLRAVICSNDSMALSLIDEASRRGLEVPRDILVIGFDDYDSAMIGPVSLTTVRQPYRDLAKAATRAAIALARGETPPEIGLLPTRFVIRNSCGCSTEGVRSISLSPESPGKAEEWRAAAEARLAAATAESRQPREALVPRLRKLLDAYSLPIADGSRFLDALGECLAAESLSTGDPLLWHAALSVLSNRPGPFPREEAHARSACLQRARILVEESNLQLRLRNSAKISTNQWTAERLVSRLLLGHDREKLGAVLSEELSNAGIPSAVVALYRSPLGSEDAPGKITGKRLSILCAYVDPGSGSDGGVYRAAFGEDYPAQDIFPTGFPSVGRDYALTPLRHADTEYGIILQEIASPRAGIDYGTISQQIGAAYKRLLIEEERFDARRELETALESLRGANEKLFGLSRQDELSGLLNRRGFMEDAERSLALAKRMKAECVVFFMDMDGLKDINDTYGHDSGDAALRGFSAILRDVFRSTDIVSRLGGDEFVAFSFMGGTSAPAMLGRIEDALAEFNREAGMPWTLSASVGAAAYDPGRHVGLESVIKDADASSYLAKMKKKGARPPSSPASP